MPSLDQTEQPAASLYWLAFLLTGEQESSAEIATTSLDGSENQAFFSAWMLSWARKVVIARALAAIRPELTASARRIAAASRRRHAPGLPWDWTLASDAGKPELERALLAIDAFPRCVLLLLMFEGISMDDAIVLLDADRELIRKAQVFALQELASNLAGEREASLV